MKTTCWGGYATTASGTAWGDTATVLATAGARQLCGSNAARSRFFRVGMMDDRATPGDLSKQFVQRIDQFVNAFNATCKPFEWTATADSSFESYAPNLITYYRDKKLQSPKRRHQRARWSHECATTSSAAGLRSSDKSQIALADIPVGQIGQHSQKIRVADSQPLAHRRGILIHRRGR